MKQFIEIIAWESNRLIDIDMIDMIFFKDENLRNPLIHEQVSFVEIYVKNNAVPFTGYFLKQLVLPVKCWIAGEESLKTVKIYHEPSRFFIAYAENQDKIENLKKDSSEPQWQSFAEKDDSQKADTDQT